VAIHTFSTLSKDCRATCADSGASTTSRRLFLLHVQTVEPRTHREDRYATCANGSVSWPFTHSRLCRTTVALHVQTVAPRPHLEDRYATCADGLGHFRYSQRCRATVSLHVQTAVPRPRHYATCADWRYRVWLYRMRRRTPKILGVASQPCSTWSSQSVSRIMGLTVFEATKTKGSMSLSCRRTRATCVDDGTSTASRRPLRDMCER